MNEPNKELDTKRASAFKRIKKFFGVSGQGIQKSRLVASEKGGMDGVQKIYKKFIDGQ